MFAIRVSVFVLLLAVARTHGAATLSLKAVAVNGEPITPTNSLIVAPGDIVRAEIYVSGWGSPPFDPPYNTGLIQTFQWALRLLDFIPVDGSCGSGQVLPLGWDAPWERDPCPCDDPRYPVCLAGHGCVGPDHHPEQMARIDRFRVDYVFYSFSSFSAVDLDSLDIRGGATIDDIGGQTTTISRVGSAPLLSPTHRHARPLLLLLQPKSGRACGTVTIGFVPDVIQTFFSSASAAPVALLPSLESLTLNTMQNCSVAACCDDNTGFCIDDAYVFQCQAPGFRYGGECSRCEDFDPPCGERWNIIEVVTPPHCTIDARVPYIQSAPAQRRGVTSITFAFKNPPGTGEDTPNDFQVTQFPATAPPNPPAITGVIAGPGANDRTLHFSNPIQSNRWTCVRHIASNTRRCIGYLPGDANSNGTAVPSDILGIVDNLNGALNPPLLLHQCDIDRNGLCTPADIITSPSS